MSCIFYYSNYCPNCRSYIQTLSHSSVKDDIHFICLDKRTKKPNGSTYVTLDNGQEILLPPTITKVPALLLLNEGHRVLFGEQIQSHFQQHPQSQSQQHSQSQSQQHSQSPSQQHTQSQPMDEPDAFALGRGAGAGVASDHFSFLDQTSDELSAKGDGGMRQHHHYAGVNFSDVINTPEDTYEPDKIGNVSMDKLQEERNQDIGLK